MDFSNLTTLYNSTIYSGHPANNSTGHTTVQHVSESDLRFRHIVNDIEIYWIPLLFVIGKYCLGIHHQYSIRDISLTMEMGEIKLSKVFSVFSSIPQ